MKFHDCYYDITHTHIICTFLRDRSRKMNTLVRAALKKQGSYFFCFEKTTVSNLYQNVEEAGHNDLLLSHLSSDNEKGETNCLSINFFGTSYDVSHCIVRVEIPPLYRKDPGSDA